MANTKTKEDGWCCGVEGDVVIKHSRVMLGHGLFRCPHCHVGYYKEKP